MRELYHVCMNGFCDDVVLAFVGEDAMEQSVILCNHGNVHLISGEGFAAKHNLHLLRARRFAWFEHPFDVTDIVHMAVQVDVRFLCAGGKYGVRALVRETQLGKRIGSQDGDNGIVYARQDALRDGNGLAGGEIDYHPLACGYAQHGSVGILDFKVAPCGNPSSATWKRLDDDLISPFWIFFHVDDEARENP